MLLSNQKNIANVAFIILLLLFLTVSCSGNHVSHVRAKANSRANIPVYTYQIIHSYPHDSAAFTQGLIYNAGILYESTGRYGESEIRQLRLEDGMVFKRKKLDANLFGEGLTLYNDKLIQLTYRAHLGFVYDKNNLQTLRVFNINTQGWGLTHDTEHLIMSDGSDTLYFLDPQTFAIVRWLKVSDGTRPVYMLNELEMIQGKIYANVYMTDKIAIISPQTGVVTAWLDLTGLLAKTQVNTTAGVLNGIAYDSITGRLFVTGKLWPKLFEIEILVKSN